MQYRSILKPNLFDDEKHVMVWQTLNKVKVAEIESSAACFLYGKCLFSHRPKLMYAR